MEYSIENIDVKLALADQAVSELRLQGFDKEFKNTKVSVYKSAPLSISIEVLSGDKAEGFEVLLKEKEYLRQNFSVSELTETEIVQIEPNLMKYLTGGLFSGFLLGLIISLMFEYRRNY